MTPAEAVRHAIARAEQAKQLAHTAAEALRETTAEAARSLPPTEPTTGTEETPR